MDPLPQGAGSAAEFASNGPEAWFYSLPPVTRAMTCLIFCCTLFVSLGLLPASLLVLEWTRVLQQLQLWRLLTNVLYLGPFSFGWLLHMYLWTQVSSDLENNAVFQQASSKGAYLYFIVLQTLCLDLLSLLVFWPTGYYVLGGSLLFAVLYYWSRRESYTPVYIYFLTVQGHQLPFVLMLLHLLMGKDLWSDVIGLLAGHIYYFFREVLPAQGVLQQVQSRKQIHAEEKEREPKNNAHRSFTPFRRSESHGSSSYQNKPASTVSSRIYGEIDALS